MSLLKAFILGILELSGEHVKALGYIILKMRYIKKCHFALIFGFTSLGPPRHAQLAGVDRQVGLTVTQRAAFVS